MKRFASFLLPLVCGFAQQPWTTVGSFAAQGVGGPAVATSAGELYISGGFGGLAQPTKILGSPTQYYAGVAKINVAGTPVFGVQINGAFLIYSMAVDTSGNLLIAGQGPGDGFPATPGAFSTTSSGPNSSFVCKLSGLDGTPIFCTYLNSNQISIVALDSDGAGNVYIFADRNSAPVAPTAGALALGDKALLLMKLDPKGSQLIYAAEFGGSGREGATALKVDAAGSAYLLGPTSSPDFPGAANGALPVPAPWFVAKIDTAGAKILYSSYLRANDTPAAITVDNAGSLYVTGAASAGALSSLFTLKLTPAGGDIAYETVLPPTGSFSLSGIALDTAGNATIAGNTGFVGFPSFFGTSDCHLSNATGTNPTDSFFVRLDTGGALLQSTFVGTSGMPTFTLGITAGTNSAYLVTGSGVTTIGPDISGASATGIGCYSNAASFLPGPVAPGEVVSVFGEGLGPAGGSIGPTGAQATFDGVPAPILYAQARQLNLITPWALAGKTSTKMCVSYLTKSSCATVSVKPAAPGIFTVDGTQPAAVNQDGTLNSPQNPAHTGSIVSLYLTGLGAITPQPADGAVIQLPLPSLIAMPQVLGEMVSSTGFKGAPVGYFVPLQVLYAGPAPLEVGGLFQINFVVPSFDGRVAVTIPQAGGLPSLSSQLVTLAVAP